VRILAIDLVCAERLRRTITILLQEVASGALSAVRPVTILFRLVPDETHGTLGLEVDARQAVVVNIAVRRVPIHTVQPLHTKQGGVRAQSDQGAARALNVARPVAPLRLDVPEQLVGTLANVVGARLAHVVHVAVLLVGVRAVGNADAKGRVVLLLRGQHLARALDVPLPRALLCKN